MTRLRLTIPLVTVLITCALPSVAPAQPWLEAYQAGDYRKAGNLLPEIVSDQDKALRGAYVFGVNVTKGRYRPPSGPTTFLPGTAVVKDAAVFDLKPGDRTDLGVLRLTSR